MIIKGYVSAYEDRVLTVVAPLEDDYLLIKRNITECEIRLDDGRKISADQRKKIYATMRDISIWSGHLPDEIKAVSKYDFIAKTGCDYFSLSDCSMTTANEFLSYLIDFCIEQDIPTTDRLLDRSPDTARYLYTCIIHKKCCITGEKSELHHMDAVGAGRDRKEIIHKGMRVLPLSREMHKEIHSIGIDTFCNKYHVFGIKMDDYLCQIWKVRSD
ncbi:MAG: putative HNHc nuclease [Clostridium sp.]|uniref:putative HNHc nuclease n=1 Tax=Clostridium sp. TaxID=1506 RepID=UPI002909C547|nr:putative HNHc nuclease [Clostridium sp.]MDU7339343.1 putative HNHc nuclease [Clostridium sp.]